MTTNKRFSGFTAKFIESLKPAEKTYQEREGKGFGIRVFPTGEKTWFFAYKIHGRQRMMTLGSYPDLSSADARKKFEEARRDLANGVDPLEKKQGEKHEPTVEILVGDFLKYHVKEKATRSLDEYKRNLEKDVVPAWGKRKAKDIKKRDVIALLDGIKNRGAANQANQVFKITRKMFNFAVARDVIEYSPCAGVAMPSTTKEKTRHLTEDEIKTFWKELDQAGMTTAMKQALRLILLTGQRPGEVIGMHRREIDGDWWTIPVERAKNKQEHRVYLTPLVQSILATLPKEGFLFPSPAPEVIDGQRIDKPIDGTALAHAIRRNSVWDKERQTTAKRLAAKKRETRKKCSTVEEKKEHFTFSITTPWTPHDLRRSCATGLGRLGYQDEMIAHVLNHKRKSVTAIYNRHAYDSDVKAMLLKWETRVSLLIAGPGEPAKVIPLRQPA